MVYCAESLSLAALESFVHFDSALLPDDFVVYELDIPAHVSVERLEPADLPANWAEIPGPVELQLIGSAWLTSARTAVLIVPSAVVEREHNVLLNPEHPDFSKITSNGPSPFLFDARMKKLPASKAPKKPAKPRARKAGTRSVTTASKPSKRSAKKR
jgi:RES domain-containing protein